MSVVSSPTRNKSWQNGRQRANLIAQMALRQTQVAETLTRLRKEHRLTQEKAAERASVPVRQWQRWEGAETMPHPRNLERLAQAFEITVSEILGDDVSAPTPDVLEALNPQEAQELRKQLDRIEEKLDKLLNPPKAPSRRPPPKPRQRKP